MWYSYNKHTDQTVPLTWRLDACLNTEVNISACFAWQSVLEIVNCLINDMLVPNLTSSLTNNVSVS